jgi:hypothetical protein
MMAVRSEFYRGGWIVRRPLGYGIVTFEVTIIAINCIVLIVSGALLSVVFKRAGRLHQNYTKTTP